jgi:hypothetical protein
MNTILCFENPQDVTKRRRKMGSKLSHELMDLGFFSALGTIDCGEHVKRRQPFMYDSNNGVQAVYDEEGRPWIKSSRLMSNQDQIQLGELIRTFNIKHGANVPHSNDGGNFMRNILPTL